MAATLPHAAGLLDVLSEPLLLLDLQGGMQAVNRAALRLLGLPAAPPPGTPLADLCADPGDPADRAIDALLRQGARCAQFSPGRLALRGTGGRAATLRCEIARVAGSDETQPLLLLRLQPQAAAGGRFIALNERIEALSREVARRRVAEAALREQSEWLHVVLRSIGDAVVATDAKCRVVFMNPIAEKLCGCSEAEARGRASAEVVALVHAQTRAPVADPLRRALAERRILGLDGQTLLVARDGPERPIDDAAGPIIDSQGRLLGAVLVFREISERVQAEQARRLLEQQLRNAQKMEAVGTLAGGIAHDFNNVLGAILGNAVLAQEELEPDHPVLPRLAQIDRAGRRARDLVRQIMAFSRRQPQQLRRQAMAPLVEECATLLRSTLPAPVQLRVLLADEPLHVLADATQVQQVLMNLCTNAWHALRGSSGRIGITLDVWDGGEPPGLAPGFGPWRGGRHARVTVSDDGCGMDEATLQRIFEPFFTTKPQGTGTGLGLAVAHGIVAEHRGALAVESRVGQGTRFHLLLPLTDEPDSVPAPLDIAVPVPAAGRGQHVLVVDDDEVMVATVEALLQRAGFRVSAFASPRPALRALAAAPASYDAVVTDFNMPQLDGLQLATEVRRLRPGLPVILSSGYLSDDLRAGAEVVGSVCLLAKEETFERLPMLLDTVLAGTGGPPDGRH
ncbi:MAG: PAS domain-containing protein [Rubrivivax sp.]|nr:PAS domain-containing protein [Rubrivivax sp.]